ncbi:hypothetical protein [Nocardia sp. NPDC049149]|uniref:hypothetical protein n=1 Tax=Nocardia sp. NPDC049149 TaxID=3364315 RepID=UPI00371A0231
MRFEVSLLSSDRSLSSAQDARWRSTPAAVAAADAVATELRDLGLPVVRDQDEFIDDFAPEAEMERPYEIVVVSGSGLTLAVIPMADRDPAWHPAWLAEAIDLLRRAGLTV